KPGIRRAPGGAPRCEPDMGSRSPEASLPLPPTPSSPSSRCPEKPSSLIQPAAPEVHNFRFSANKAFKEKLLRAAEVLGIKNPQRNLAEVLERVLDLALEKKDPQ